MSLTPFEYIEGVRIGTVDFVSPDEIKVSLEIDSPESVALNAGSVRPFPRVNGYALVSVDEGYLVGQIGWLTIERSPFPKRRGLQDFGLIDLPFPLRRMSLNPLGMLTRSPGSSEAYSFRRGADSLPSLGSSVLLPTDIQLRAIVESGNRRRVRVGTSPLAANAEVRVDPDRLFGRHVAVLGNTGSGKSCSVAGLIRWSLDAARAGRNEGRPNARFIVLDPNGEYARTFNGVAGCGGGRVFKVDPGEGDLQLCVPMWLWSNAEWAAFSQASSKTQRPTLVQALRNVRDGVTEPAESQTHDIRRLLRIMRSTLRVLRNSGAPFSGFPKSKNFFELLEAWKNDLAHYLVGRAGEQEQSLTSVVDTIDELCGPFRGQRYPNHIFEIQKVDLLQERFSHAHSVFGGKDEELGLSSVDCPRWFLGDSLLRSVEATAEMLGVAEHVETLLIRLRSLFADSQMMAVIGDDAGIDLASWLADYIGGDSEEQSPVAVIDLSLVPSGIVHVVTAVAARMAFEALQRYRRMYRSALPTVLVMEEAHTFIKRYREGSEDSEAGAICCQVFERIAREGRKFGLGLVLSSQRPSELSPTVLSQCNTFLLHRISNDRDQDIVHRLVPDNLRGLLRELPSLPSQHAILLGWASEIPILVRMDDLPASHRPHSDDPDFWEVWVGVDEDGHPVQRGGDWVAVAREWQGTARISPDDGLGVESGPEEETHPGESDSYGNDVPF